jgi:hypothetical protein
MGNLQTFNLGFFKSKINATAFFETGLGSGSGLVYASAFNFDILISTEIDENAIIRFKNSYSEGLSKTSKIHIFKGNSAEILDNALPLIDAHKSCIFWLDAHFPGETSGFSYEHEKNISVRLPLEQEIEAILKHRANKKDIIIIDDIRIYEKRNYEAKCLDDIGLSHLAKYENQINQLLEKKFDIYKFDIDTGFAVCLPK